MAEQVEVPIITASAVQSLADLKAAISEAKKTLDGLTIGDEKYQEQLQELIKMQNLMKGAMNGTTASMEDLDKAAEGTSKTYNGLVNQMANMKRELRNIDISTEAGKKAFDDLAGKIKEVNDQLKDLDAQKGDFQRNVGNYEGALKGWAKSTDALDKGLKAVTHGVGGVKGGMEALAASPTMATFGILVSVALKLVDSLKDNETAMAGVKKGMDALKPVMDFFSGLLEKIATWLADIIGKAANFLGSSGILQKVIQGVMGVGNAILKFVVAPFKGVIEAIKVFKEQGVKGLGDAAKAFGREMKSGVAFKENYTAGQAAADAIISGMSSQKSKDKAKAAGKEVGKSFADGMYEAAMRGLKRAEANEAIERAKKDFYDTLAGMLAEADEEWAETFADETDAEFQANLEALKAYTDEEAALYEKQKKDAEDAAKNKIASMQAFASGTADLLGAIADAYESNGELNEREEKRVKNLRIAAATISMLQGAVTAYASAQSLGVPMGPIVGAINAAAVVATGIANINKIKSTNVSRDSAPSTDVATPATVQAPAMETAVPTTTVVNGATTERALNNASRPQKVYVVQSEVEAVGNIAEVTEGESSF